MQKGRPKHRQYAARSLKSSDIVLNELLVVANVEYLHTLVCTAIGTHEVGRLEFTAAVTLDQVRQG